VRIGRQWLAVSIIRIVYDDEQTEIRHRCVDGVPAADHDDRIS
jgi:hypothetical protein